MLSSHLCLCLSCFLPPFTVPCKMVLARPDERETWPYHCSLRLFTVVRRSISNWLGIKRRKRDRICVLCYLFPTPPEHSPEPLRSGIVSIPGVIREDSLLVRVKNFLLISLLVKAPDSWSKGCEFENRQKRRENVLLPQWHVKGHGHSTKSAVAG